MHYLDNAATTVVDADLAKLCYDTMLTYFGNPSSLYAPGMWAEQQMEKARQQVAESLGVAAETITFTGCGTESDNIAIFGAAEKNKAWAKNIVATGFEHPAVYRTLEKLQKNGWEIRLVPPEQNGTLCAEKLLDAVDGKTGLVTFMFVNNEIGTMQNVAKLSQEVRQKAPRCAIHVDGVQGWCKHPINLSILPVDSFALSGHKMHCPKGIGALYLRKNYKIEPVFGGGGQEKGLRPGTENLPYIVALGAAAEKYGSGIKKRLEKTAGLNTLLRQKLEALEGVAINSPADASPYVLNFSLPGVRSETMLHFLEQKKIYVSSGSACSKGAASHTLLSMGLSSDRIDGALRVSFCDQSSESDVTALTEALAEGLAVLARKR